MAQRGSCKEHILRVEDQKTEGHCVFIHFADMASTTIRMVTDAAEGTGTAEGTDTAGGTYSTAEDLKDLQLSPQLLADHTRFDENREIVDFVSHPDLGLETIGKCPYERLERRHQDWSDKEYRARDNVRYHLAHIDVHLKGEDPNQEVIKEELMKHFLTEGHLKFPWVGDLYTCTLNDYPSAKRRADDGTIYRHPIEEYYKKAADHSVLIVGINVSSPHSDEHYAEIKCSWGDAYGDKGFTRVNFDVFTKVWYPCKKKASGLGKNKGLRKRI